MRLPLILRALPFILSSALSVACGDGDDLGECPPNSAAQQSAGQQVMKSNCLTCHASQLTGDARQGAPAEYNFDDIAVVRAEAGEMYGEVLEGAMPPAPNAKITGESLEQFRIWLACGAPETAAP